MCSPEDITLMLHFKKEMDRLKVLCTCADVHRYAYNATTHKCILGSVIQYIKACTLLVIVDACIDFLKQMDTGFYLYPSHSVVRAHSHHPGGHKF